MVKLDFLFSAVKMCKFHFFPSHFNLFCADSDPPSDVSAGHSSSLLPGFLFPSSCVIFFVGLLPGLGWGQLGPYSFHMLQVKVFYLILTADY